MQGSLNRICRSLVIFTTSWCVLASIGCGGPAQNVQAEANLWGAFRMVQNGDLAAGQTVLPAPVRQGFCYRVLVSTASSAPPQLAYQGEIDADSTGFPIHTVESRSALGSAARVTVFGFCSQGAGTVQLVATLPAAGHGALVEAPFSGLGPNDGPDVVQAHDWLVAQERQAAERRQAQDAARREEAMHEFAANVGGVLQERLGTVVQSRGRYPDTILDEVRAGPGLEEALILEPGRCYVFALMPYQATRLEVDLRFSRIRNAAERSDEGGITYSVCTAPSGPVQEVTFRVSTQIPQNSQHPPVFAVRVAHRAQSAAERRAAVAEWLANDPEARIE